MAQYLVRFSYTPASIKGLIEQPQLDHAEEASGLAESLGGKVLGYWFAFGEFDGVLLLEAADASTAASIAMAVASTGAVSKLETTVLLTMDEARPAIHRSASAAHLPPGPKGER
jgi:uncharacterized protein with GYD domain